jgi:hypothetical protein
MSLALCPHYITLVLVLIVKTVPVATEYSSKTTSPFSLRTAFPFSSTTLPSFEGLNLFHQ